MSANADQSLREIATHLRSIDDSLKTIAKAVEFRSGATTLREFIEGGTPGGSIPARRAPTDDGDIGYLAPYKDKVKRQPYS